MYGANRRPTTQMTAPPPQAANVIEARLRIRRPVGEVFAFYRDFRNLPLFLGDVMAVEPTGPGTSRWRIQGPLGIRVHWTIKVTEARANELIRYETSGLPGLRVRWSVYFEPGAQPGETQLREVMTSPLGRIGRVALALIGKDPMREVTANLHRLKQVMETGRVTDTGYAVPGKFSELGRREIRPPL
jgi:uncharacterized membrane protein